MECQLSGKFQVWKLLGNSRTYADITLPYGEAREYVMPVRYNALTGRGEQRALFDSHVRRLKNEMSAGNFTPTQMSAGLHERHRQNLNLNEDGTFSLNINSDDPLGQTDGGHRYGALDLIEKELKSGLEKATEEKEKSKIQSGLDELALLPVGIRLYFDGNMKVDFINLQSGRPVDQAHMLSLKIQQRVLADPEYKLAFDIAKALHKAENSPFSGLLRFDSRISDKASLVKQLPISTLFAKSSSDLATSLVGLAKIGLAYDKSDVEFLANCVVASSSAISKAEGLAQTGKVLTPPRNGGSKGSATMLIGLAICLAQRVLSTGRTEVTEDDISLLVESAQVTLDKTTDGTFSGGVKRTLMGDFARAYLADTEVEFHDGLPKTLVQTLSCSAFDAQPLPKTRKNAETATAASVEADDDDVTAESLAEQAGEVKQTQTATEIQA